MPPEPGNWSLLPAAVHVAAVEMKRQARDGLIENTHVCVDHRHLHGAAFIDALTGRRERSSVPGVSRDLKILNMPTLISLYNGHMFDYDMLALIRNSTKYIRKKVASDSFRAFYSMLMDEKTLLSSVMDIYCREKSGDFQLMGVYDELSVMNQNGEYKSHILKTMDGNTYTLSDDGFVSVN